MALPASLFILLCQPSTLLFILGPSLYHTDHSETWYCPLSHIFSVDWTILSPAGAASFSPACPSLRKWGRTNARWPFGRTYWSLPFLDSWFAAQTAEFPPDCSGKVIEAALDCCCWEVNTDSCNSAFSKLAMNRVGWIGRQQAVSCSRANVVLYTTCDLRIPWRWK